MRAVVFIGPSLPVEDAKQVLYDADYRPPASRGDITAAVSGGASVVGLIDGVFYQQAAVSHREILEAIRKGVRVVGGGSMGALRASELDVYGMEGVGQIYEWYKSGEIRSDDEVALAFHPDGFRPLSEPLVNIRATLGRMLGAGAITPHEHGLILASAKEVPFQLRNNHRIMQRAVKNGLNQERAGEILKLMKAMRVDLKREDAIMVLKRVKELAKL